MTEGNGTITRCPDDIPQHVLQIVEQCKNLPKKTTDELLSVLLQMTSFPFQDEEERNDLFEKVKVLQPFHAIQICLLGVVPLQANKTDPAKFLEDVHALFQNCLSFCYHPDESQRVAFEFYIKILKFCFPSDGKEPLPTTAVSLLLQLVQVLQAGKLAEFSVGDLPTQTEHIKGTNSLFNELLELFQSRRGESHIVDVIIQTVGLASADSKVQFLQAVSVNGSLLRSEHFVTPVFLRKWMQLLKFTNASNGFILRVVKRGDIGCQIGVPILSSGIDLNPGRKYKGIIFAVVDALQEMNKDGDEIYLPNDEERLDVFFNCISRLCTHRKITVTLLKLLAFTSIRSTVLKEVIDLFLLKEEINFQLSLIPLAVNFKATSFDLVSKILLSFPDGKLVIEILTFWKETFSADPLYAALVGLMEIITAPLLEKSAGEGDCPREKMERLLNFISWLPGSLMPLMYIWKPFLTVLMKIFPSSFEKRPEVLVFVHKALQIGTHPKNDQANQLGTGLRTLDWIAKQSSNEEIKQQMTWLLMHCDQFVGFDEFSMSLSKSLCLCRQLSFNCMKLVVREVSALSKRFKGLEREILQDFVHKLASKQSLEIKEVILTEFLDTVRRWLGKQSPIQAIPSKALELLSLITDVSVSGPRILKILQYSRESSKGLCGSVLILRLIKIFDGIVKGATSKYFDLLFAAVFETLRGDKKLCERFYQQIELCQYSSSEAALYVWSSAVAGLISLGLFDEKIDSQCCLPVLTAAVGFHSCSDVLQLYVQARSAVSQVIRRLKNDALSSNAADCPHDGDASRPDAGTALLEHFITPLTIIVSSDNLSAIAKILLIRRVCDKVLIRPLILTDNTLTNALSNTMAHSFWKQSHSSSNDAVVSVDLAYHRIVAILDDPGMLNQLARLPVNPSKSLWSVLSTKVPDPLSEDDVMEIYGYISSLNDVHQAFFDHLIYLLEILVVQRCNLVAEVLEFLKELVDFLLCISPELIPLTILNFEHLLKNNVSKEQRKTFIQEVAAQWEVVRSPGSLFFFDVSRLLWLAYKSASGPTKEQEAITHIHNIVKKSTKLEKFDMERIELECNRELVFRREIACRDLEWLSLHSSLASEDVALALDLCCLIPFHCLECFTFSGEHAQDGPLVSVPPQQEEAGYRTKCQDMSSLIPSNEQDTSVLEQETAIQTPAKIAHKLILRLKDLLEDQRNISETALQLWKSMFHREEVNCTDPVCKSQCSPRSVLVDYVNVFLSILDKAPSVDVAVHWTALDPHHVCQCSKVILNACEWDDGGESLDKDAILNLQAEVSAVLEAIRPNTPNPLPLVFFNSVSCFQSMAPQLQDLSSILEKKVYFQLKESLIKLARINLQAGVAIGEIVSLWSSNTEATKLLSSIQTRCEKGAEMFCSPQQSEFVWNLLRAWGRMFVNSSQKAVAKLDELIIHYEPEDNYGLDRLPKWRELMLSEGFPARAIDSWCVGFLHKFLTPHTDLTSRDVDAIADLTPSSLQLVSSVSHSIQRCIFPEVGFKESSFKERLRLARLLGEFLNILKLLKPEEFTRDAVVKGIVIDACDELCRSYEDETKKRNDLYKIHGQKLKSLFTEVFGKKRIHDRTQVDGEVTHQEDGHQAAMVRVARQTSYLHENLPQVLNHTKLYESMLVLLRRWLTGIVKKPVMATYIREIVELLFSKGKDQTPLKELHGTIQNHILCMERNQALIAQLQAVGYNQGDSDTSDLWSSPSLELTCYLSRRESPNDRRLTKKLTEILRRLWTEWKDILFMLCIFSIKVGSTVVQTKDLFGPQASLSEMESQVSVIKTITKQYELQQPRMTRLLRLERQHRTRIDKQRATIEETKTRGSEREEMQKFVAVWENRFLESVKLCSERIPGCYAPNGFHSEKPALCGLSVDNRILTVFKEGKNGREEIEDVEVKLFDAGMYVFGLHTSGHDFVTDELWAAFYKMLLEKKLVPRIVLSNESPGFDWIKRFVEATASHPHPWKWELPPGIVPADEDYFDYTPIHAAIWPSMCGLKDFITLTTDNVAGFQFNDLKDVESVELKEKQTRQMTKRAIEELSSEINLLELHGRDGRVQLDSKSKVVLVGRLKFAIKQTVKKLVEGETPTIESVMEHIDMAKLCRGYPEFSQTEQNQRLCTNAVLRACRPRPVVQQANNRCDFDRNVLTFVAFFLGVCMLLLLTKR